MSNELSPADERLLALLQQNARASVSDLARALKLSRTTVQARIERLERSGVILGYSVRISEATFAHHVRAHTLLRVNPKLTTQVLAAAARVNGLQSLHSIAGEFDLLAQLRCPDAQALDAALDAIAQIEGVERTQSSLLLAQKLPL
jgi:DNA-binding Lrp family transcriptional regulator